MELAEKGVKVRSMYENHIVFGLCDACLKWEKERPVVPGIIAKNRRVKRGEEDV